VGRAANSAPGDLGRGVWSSVRALENYEAGITKGMTDLPRAEMISPAMLSFQRRHNSIHQALIHSDPKRCRPQPNTSRTSRSMPGYSLTMSSDNINNCSTRGDGINSAPSALQLLSRSQFSSTFSSSRKSSDDDTKLDLHMTSSDPDDSSSLSLTGGDGGSNNNNNIDNHLGGRRRPLHETPVTPRNSAVPEGWAEVESGQGSRPGSSRLPVLPPIIRQSPAVGSA